MGNNLAKVLSCWLYMLKAIFISPDSVQHCFKSLEVIHFDT